MWTVFDRIGHTHIVVQHVITIGKRAKYGGFCSQACARVALGVTPQKATGALRRRG